MSANAHGVPADEDVLVRRRCQAHFADYDSVDLRVSVQITTSQRALSRENEIDAVLSIIVAKTSFLVYAAPILKVRCAGERWRRCLAHAASFDNRGVTIRNNHSSTRRIAVPSEDESSESAREREKRIASRARETHHLEGPEDRILPSSDAGEVDICLGTPIWAG